MSTNFKIFDPVGQLVASEGGGGGLPLTGGTLTGNLLMQGSKVVQCTLPSDECDLTNKEYVDDNFQKKAPLAVANNIAFFGDGSNTGQTIDSGLRVDNNLNNEPSNDTLWVSNRIVGSLRFGAEIFKATASINISSSNSIFAFFNGSEKVGPSTWPDLGSTFTLGLGTATISNSFPYDAYFRITFMAKSMSESTGAAGRITCQFVDESSEFFGVEQNLNCLPTSVVTPAFCDSVCLSALVGVASASSFSFAVLLTNPGANQVTIDPNPNSDQCLLIIEKVG